MHPVIVQIGMEFAAALRRENSGKDVGFKIHVSPPAVEDGFFVATCVHRGGGPVGGIKPIEFRPN